MANYLKDKYYPGGYPDTEWEKAEPARASRVQKKVTRTTTFDFGRGPYTVEDFKDFYEHIKDLPEGAKCHIQYWDDQRDGQSFKVTVNE